MSFFSYVEYDYRSCIVSATRRFSDIYDTEQKAMKRCGEYTGVVMKVIHD